jgi:diguanylate cyclase (GGDEF)-like protein
MTITAKGEGSAGSEELRRFEHIITDGRFAGNPLLPEFSLLFELYKKASIQATTQAQEFQRLKTQLVEMNRSLDLATRIDPLTGLANRRDIMEKIEQEHSRAHRHKRTYSLILVDIDDFKKINDTFGLNTGDEVIFEVSSVLRGCVRSEDICARWGGEEFLFLLPETGVDGALAVAQKVNQSVAMTEFKVNKPGIRLTVSLGVCEYRPGQSMIDTLNRVEQGLFQAKQSGKNRCIVAA